MAERFVERDEWRPRAVWHRAPTISPAAKGDGSACGGAATRCAAIDEIAARFPCCSVAAGRPPGAARRPGRVRENRFWLVADRRKNCCSEVPGALSYERSYLAPKIVGGMGSHEGPFRAPKTS